MNHLFSRARVRGACVGLVLAAILPIATVASASRVGGAAAPAASAVQAAAQQPAHVQADDSASLRRGTITAVDERGARVQVQGIWIDIVAGKSELLRNGRAAGLGTLKSGEPIRFTVVPGSAGAPAMKVIYAP